MGRFVRVGIGGLLIVPAKEVRQALSDGMVSVGGVMAVVPDGTPEDFVKFLRKALVNLPKNKEVE